ncbi:MAG: extensin family protein [Pseudolabrys sp.]|nr:extensin family protein [Pseudolabrys sp.]
MVRWVVAILVVAGTGGVAAAQPAIISVPPQPAAAAPAAAPAAPAAAAAVPLPPARPRTPVKPAWTEPRTFLEAAGPDFKSAEVTSEPSECRLRLEAIAVVTPLPRLIGPGACGGGDMVQLEAVRLPNGSRVEVRPGPVLRCGMAESFAAWIRDEAAPRVLKDGSALQRVSVADDFNCRGRNRVAGARLSEHGKGNAVDIRAFTLANNKTIDLTDMHAPQELREDMKVSICARFTTVLGPGSDGYHEEHIHMDLAERRGGYRICQWNVRVPPPPPPPVAAVPVPPEPPAKSQDKPQEKPPERVAMTMRSPFDGKAVPLPVPKPALAQLRQRGKRKL